MPEVTSYPQGMPSWVDLATTNPRAAQRFYGTLFGWEFEEQEPGGPPSYAMCSKGGKAVAGIMPMSAEMEASGVPPMWASYVTVADIERTVARVEPAGGTVLQPPMEIVDAGRMALITDPTGGTLALWEAKNHIGAQLVNEHGTLIWNELMTPDAARAAAFYADVIGWRSETTQAPHGDYTVFLLDTDPPRGIAGALPPPEPGLAPFWGVYFGVDDCDATTAHAAKLGATVHAGPMDIPEVGRFAFFTDPQGAGFYILQPFSTPPPL